jgi:hypothetical protein
MEDEIKSNNQKAVEQIRFARLYLKKASMVSQIYEQRYETYEDLHRSLFDVINACCDILNSEANKSEWCKS